MVQSRSPSPFVPGAWPATPFLGTLSPQSLDIPSSRLAPSLEPDTRLSAMKNRHSGGSETASSRRIEQEPKPTGSTGSRNDIHSPKLSVPWLWRSADPPLARRVSESPGLITPTGTSTPPLSTVFTTHRSPQIAISSSDESSFLHSPSWETSFGDEITEGILFRQDMAAQFSTPLPMRVAPPIDCDPSSVDGETPLPPSECQETKETDLPDELRPSQDTHPAHLSTPQLVGTSSRTYSGDSRFSSQELAHIPTSRMSPLGTFTTPNVAESTSNDSNIGPPGVVFDALGLLAASDQARNATRRRPASEPVPLLHPGSPLSPRPKWKKLRETVKTLFQHRDHHYTRRNSMVASSLNLDMSNQRTYTIDIEVPREEPPMEGVSMLLESSDMSWDLVSSHPSSPPGLSSPIETPLRTPASEYSGNEYPFSTPRPPHNSPSSPFPHSPRLIESDSSVVNSPCGLTVQSTDPDPGSERRPRSVSVALAGTSSLLSRTMTRTNASKEKGSKRKSHRFSFTAFADRISNNEVRQPQSSSE